MSNDFEVYCLLTAISVIIVTFMPTKDEKKTRWS